MSLVSKLKHKVGVWKQKRAVARITGKAHKKRLKEIRERAFAQAYYDEEEKAARKLAIQRAKEKIKKKYRPRKSVITPILKRAIKSGTSKLSNIAVGINEGSSGFGFSEDMFSIGINDSSSGIGINESSFGLDLNLSGSSSRRKKKRKKSSKSNLPDPTELLGW